MTAKIKMIIPKTKVKFPNAPTVFPIIEMSKLSVGQDLANLNTRSYERRTVYIRISGRGPADPCRIGILTNRKDLKTDNPETFSRLSSKSDKATMRKSKMFHPSRK